jgi:anthranilate synthase component 1
LYIHHQISFRQVFLNSRVPCFKIYNRLGGAVGYISYDCVRFFEPASNVANLVDSGVPDAVLLFCDALIIFDHLHHTCKIVSHCTVKNGDLEAKEYDRAVAEIDEIITLLESPETKVPSDSAPSESSWQSNIGKDGYTVFVDRIKGTNIFLYL